MAKTPDFPNGQPKKRKVEFTVLPVQPVLNRLLSSVLPHGEREQENALRIGVLLASRGEGEHVVYLVQLESFYVEVILTNKTVV